MSKYFGHSREEDENRSGGRKIHYVIWSTSAMCVKSRNACRRHRIFGDVLREIITFLLGTREAVGDRPSTRLEHVTGA